jgi:hypothetical protein
MRYLLVFVMLALGTALSAASRFEVIEAKVPGSISPGEKFAVSVRLKALSLDAPAYYRPVADLQWDNGRIRSRLKAGDFVPWKVEKISEGGEFGVTLNLQAPAELQGGESGTISFGLHHPESKTYASIDGKNRSVMKLQVKAVEKMQLTDRLPLLVVPLIQAPTLDGSLDDWKGAAEIPLLVRIADGKAASQRTSVRIGYDRKNIYVAFQCSESDMNSIAARQFSHHDGAIFNNDSIEMIFRPETEKLDFAQFIVDTLNQRMDTWSGDFAGFNPVWRSVVAKQADGWTVEASIPVSSITGRPVEAGTVWQGNFFRGKGGREYQAWSPTFGSTSLVNRYGFLVFESVKKALTNLAAEISLPSKELDLLKQRINSGSEERLADSFPEIREQLRACAREAGQRLFAEQYAASGAPVVIQPADFYSRNPPEKSNAPLLTEFKAAFLADEVRHFAFNVTNISRQTAYLRFSLRYGEGPGLDGKSYDHLRLGIPGYRIDWLTPTPAASSDGTLIWDVMPGNQGGSYKIAPGETVQAAVEIRPEDAPRLVKGHLVIQDISGGKLEVMTIPLEFSAIPVRLADAPDKILNYGWDMLWPVIAEERPEFAKAHFEALRKYGFNTVSISCLRHLPRPKADKNGKIIGDMDFTNLRNLVKLTGNTFDKYYFNVDIWEKQVQRKDLFGLDFFDPAYEVAFKNWVRRVVAEFKELGISADRLMVCPYDESTDLRAEKIASWLKECAPELTILVNSSSDDLPRIRSIDRYTDIWMPHLRTLNQETLSGYHDFLQSTGKPVMAYYYSTGPNEKLKSPYEDYMLNFWISYARNLRGLGYWAAGQYYGDPWYRKAFQGVYDTALIYPTENGVIPSRRLMGWLRGTQDFQLLKLAESKLAPEEREKLRHNVSLVIKYPGDPQRAEALRTYCREILARN